MTLNITNPKRQRHKEHKVNVNKQMEHIVKHQSFLQEVLAGRTSHPLNGNKRQQVARNLRHFQKEKELLKKR